MGKMITPSNQLAKFLEEDKKKRKNLIKEDGISPFVVASTDDEEEDEEEIAPVQSLQSYLADPFGTGTTLLDVAQQKDNAERLNALVEEQNEKAKENEGWFKSSKGGIVGKTLGTTGDILTNVFKGAGNLFEGITDLVLYGFSEGADLVGADSFSDDLKNLAKQNTVNDAFSGMENMFNEYSVLGNKSDSIAQGVGQIGGITLTGNLGNAGKLGSFAMTTGLMGLSSWGSGMSEAFQSGEDVSDADAWAYGFTKGVVDAGTEMIFGGLGKGINALGFSRGISSLDDMFAKKLSSKIANRAAKNLVQFGVKASAEGVEEWLAGLGTAFAKKLTYMSDEDLRKLIADENLLDQFVAGMITSGIAQSGIVPGMNQGSLKESIKTGTDFVTGMTQNEQKVVDKVFEDEIKQREENGETLTKKDKNKLYDEVVEQMERGEISTDTIEEVLGGESYDAYKEMLDSETALTKEQEALENEYKALQEKENKTLAEESRIEELRKQFQDNKAKLDDTQRKAQKDLLKAQLSKNVYELTKNDRLRESYFERVRADQKFEADLTQYEGRAKDVMQKVMDSGLADNTNATHEFWGMMAKMSSDLDTDITLATDEQILEMVKADYEADGLEFDASKFDGQRIDGYVSKNGIVLNAKSKKALNFVVGHEITHKFEASPKHYKKLQELLFEYAKDEYESRFNQRSGQYANKFKADEKYKSKIDKEITGDLVGDYIFNDKGFIEHLTKDRNVFMRVWDEIKYMAKIAKAGSEQAKLLEKAKREFERAYRNVQKNNTTDSSGVNLAIETTPDGKKYVRADRQVIFGNDPDSWSTQVEDYINGKIRNGENISLVAEDGDVLVLTSDTAGKIASNKTSHGTTMADEEFNVKANAGVHIDELVQISVNADPNKNPVKDRGSRHGSFAEGGWTYRTAFFQDFDGKYYRLKISAAKGADGNVVYNIGDIEERSFPKVTGSSAKGGALNGKASSADNVAQDGENVKMKFSLSEAVEETKDLVALHNLTADKLTKSLELGGLPMPSLAVTKADIPHSNFGEITLIFGRDTIDPKKNKKNKVYSADAWTPVFPRTEYEADSKVANSASQKLDELGAKVDDYFKRDLNRVNYGFESYLNSEGGEEGLVQRVMDNYGMKAAYLEDIGKHIETVTTQQEAEKNFNPASADKYQKIMDILGVTTAEEIGKVNLKDAVDNYGAELEAVYPGITKTSMRMGRMLGIVKSYIENNDAAPVYNTVVDSNATRKAVDDALDTEGYEAWVRNLFSGIVKDSGIYNNKDIFTPSGNRRSFKQTHLPVTLENIVKAMASQNGGKSKNVSGFNGIKTLRAATAETFKSVDEMHQKKGRLQNRTQEEVDALNNALQTRLYKVMEAIDNESGQLGGDNPFIRLDSIGEVLTEIGESGKYSVADIQRVFKQYSRNVSDDTAMEVKQLLYDVTQMPVNIFEAKPERVVGFDEAKVFVIPRNADVKLKQELLNRGYSIAEYDPDVEGDRKKVVNQFEQYKFSLSDVGQQHKDTGGYQYYSHIPNVSEDIAPIENSVQNVQENAMSDTPVIEKPVAEEVIEETPVTEATQKMDVRIAAEAKLADAAELAELGITSEYAKMQAQCDSASMATSADAFGTRFHIQKKSSGKYVAIVEGDGSGFVTNGLNKECDSFDEAYVACWEYIYGKSPDLYSDAISYATTNATVAENVAPVTEETEMFPDDFEPMAEDVANEQQSENFESLDDADAPMESVTEYDEIADPVTLSKNAVSEIAKEVRTSLGLKNNEMADVYRMIEEYSQGEYQSREQLYRDIKDKFGTRTEKIVNDEAQDVKSYLHSYRISVSDSIKNEIADYGELQRRNRGRIIFSRNGMPVDSAYQELHENYPQFFPESIYNPTDQLLHILDVANMDKFTENRYTIDDETLWGVTDDIIDYINDVKYTEKENFANQESREAFDSLMADFAPVAEQNPIEDAPVAEQYEAIKPKTTKEPRMARATPEEQAKNSNTAKILFEGQQTPKQKSAWKWVKEHIFSHGAVFEDLSLKTGNRELQAKFDNIRRAESKAQRFMGNSKGGAKALVDVRAEVEKSGKTEDFNYYLYHLHNVDRMTLEQRFSDVPNKSVFGDSVDAEASRKAALGLEVINPEFKQWAQDVYAITKQLRQMMVDEGIISQETADLWQEMYPHYVPISRVDAKGLNVSVPLDTKRTGVNAPIKKATGGNSDFYNVFDTMGSRIEQTFKAIAKNRFGVELMNTLGTAYETDVADIDAVLETIDAQEDLLQGGKNGESPSFTVFQNGEKVKFAITEDMYDAMKPSQFTYTNKALKKINDIRRDILTTYSPTFALTNPIKDVQDILLNSQHPAKTYATIPEAIYSVMTKDHWYQERMDNGGSQDSYFDGQTKTFKKDGGMFKKVMGFVPSKIQAANEVIEQIPRMAEYIASRKMGRSIDVSMLDAARVTTNFGAAGDVTNFANRNGFTFLGASVEGFNQQVRNIREAKAEGVKGVLKLAAKYAVAGLPAMLLNHILWDDDEDYEELSDYVKQNYYVVAKTGDGKFIRIPKGRTVSVIQDAFKQMENLITGNDEVDMESFVQLVMNNLAPNNPLENNLIAPIFQATSNKTWYGDDLVPTRLQDLPAAEQFDETTDSLSKWLGETFNVSPYKINYLIDQYTGGVGDMVLPYLTPEADGGGLGAAFRDKFVTDPVLKNQNVTDFYDKADELTVNANSSNATDEDILKYKYMSAINSELSELYQQKREIQNSDMSDKEKYAAVRDIQSQIVELTKKGLNNYEKVSIDGVYATVGDQQFRWYEPGEDSTAEPGWKKLTKDQIAKQEKVTKSLRIQPSEYWSNKEEYDYAYDNPAKYAVARSVGGYDAFKSYSKALNDIKADKDVNGKTINGSRKNKVVDYLNRLDIDYGTKLILFKSEFKSDDTYNMDIIDYLNSRKDISYKQMETILKELGFRVDADGSIWWD